MTIDAGREGERIFYVIERANNPRGIGLPDGSPLYCMWHPIRKGSGWTDWTLNIDEAIQWSTREAAETFHREHEANDPALAVVEHMYVTGAGREGEAKPRANYLTMSQNFALESALAVFDRAGLHVYMVGSALKRADYRDVDLRCILDDDEFDRRFKNRRVELRLTNAALSEWIAARTGLPIDFQYQPYRDMPQFKGEPRNAVGILIYCEAAQDREKSQ